ncbi:PREDICTED: acetyl-coenzyme A synthetase 2-like, mitochondrial [Priapulus caudatus]|uniref:Acetyl-coenzyme A synthetase n=1 Tax=Priapulus caudatus TaxID=37621 RepID=A0ABM1EUW5_PRICU|nr:PREDICTED: acetyl-coenzyme A synthetase 2-like, mitochondrial [Priapulus caudatus]
MYGRALSCALLSPTTRCTIPQLIRYFARTAAAGAQQDVTTAQLPEISQYFQKALPHQEVYDLSLNNPSAFWGSLARTRLSWYRDFDDVIDCDMTKAKLKWFINGKLNVSVNCVDRHYMKTPDKVAIIWEKDEPGQQENVSYKQLYEMMNQLANTLKSHGVRRGDRVCIYMPMTPLAVAAMLACARIGAIHSVVFAGFSADALTSRINDAKAETVITADQVLRGGKAIDLKSTVDRAVLDCPCVRQVFVAQRTGAPVSMGQMDMPLESEMAKQSTECEPEVMGSEDYLFMLYTSGSTGQPKGIAHTQAGYLLYAAITHQTVFDYREGDIYACVADIGWITGHTYVLYGPLCNGATTVLFESIPTYPDPGRYWEMVERLRVNQFYGSPTAIRLLLKYGDSWVTRYDRSSLRVLGTVGEPINTEAWEWYHNVVGNGKCDIVDTWWQTETGGICIAPRPSRVAAPIIPGAAMRPMFGIAPAIVCPDSGKEFTGNDVYGALCIKLPWPGMARTIYGHHNRYVDTYFKPFQGYYFTGDGAHRDKDGYIHITGASAFDEWTTVLFNSRRRHRLGTAEIEDSMDEHGGSDVAWAPAGCAGIPHPVKGEGVYAFVTLMEDVQKDTDEIITELKSMVKKQIGSFAAPECIQITPGLPKTRSGKIMRRILRKIAANRGDELGDVSTLADPSVVPMLIANHAPIEKKLQEMLKKKYTNGGQERTKRNKGEE